MEGVQLTFYGPETPARKPTLIRELPTDEQPVARLNHYGAGALSASELLTIAIGFDNLADAQALLAAHDNLAGLARVPLTELTAVKGIGPTRAARLQATFELGRRQLVACPADKPTIKTPADAANLLMAEMGMLEQEHLVALILDTKNHVLKKQTVYVGSLNTAVVRVGEVFREAIRLNAAAIIVAHNHPSNDPTPSAEDVYVTRSLVEAGKLLNIDVLDHMVICQSRWVSLKERGMGF